jgi:two-component system, chemotaxis family, protein-glutamate methylesterase/glutaminase
VNKIKVLVVDDAVVVRRLLTTVIEDDPMLEVVGQAPNGAIGLAKIDQLRPDIVTLDIEMPEMDGLQALAAIRKKYRDLPVIMFSTLTERGANATMEALSLGASDYVTKPANVGSVTMAMDSVRSELIPRIKALVKRAGAPVHLPSAPPPPPVKVVAAPKTGRVEVIAIGSSTGGPTALATVLQRIPANFDKPIVITQHMPAVFTRYLAQRLDSSCKIRVREAEQGDRLEAGLALLAPGDWHMTFKRTAPADVSVRLDQNEPVNFCRPSVDVMYRSLVDCFGGNVLAVILTGMGSDGRDGCIPLKQRGAEVIVQDHASSVVWGMPGAVHHAGLADQVLTLDDIGAAIVQRGSGGGRVSDPRLSLGKV